MKAKILSILLIAALLTCIMPFAAAASDAAGGVPSAKSRPVQIGATTRDSVEMLKDAQLYKFSLTQSTVPAEPQKENDGFEPFDIVITLDISSSMTDEDLALLEAAFNDIIVMIKELNDEFDSDCRFGVVLYDDSAYSFYGLNDSLLESSGETDEDADAADDSVLSFLEIRRAREAGSGQASIIKGVSAAAKMLQERDEAEQERPGYIIVMSAGVPSRSSYRQVRDYFRKADNQLYPIYTLGFDIDAAETASGRLTEVLLKAIADLCGGEYYRVDEQSESNSFAAFVQIVSEISGVEITPVAADDDAPLSEDSLQPVASVVDAAGEPDNADAENASAYAENVSVEAQQDNGLENYANTITGDPDDSVDARAVMNMSRMTELDMQSYLSVHGGTLLLSDNGSYTVFGEDGVPLDMLDDDDWDDDDDLDVDGDDDGDGDGDSDDDWDDWDDWDDDDDDDEWDDDDDFEWDDDDDEFEWDDDDDDLDFIPQTGSNYDLIVSLLMLFGFALVCAGAAVFIGYYREEKFFL